MKKVNKYTYSVALGAISIYAGSAEGCSNKKEAPHVAVDSVTVEQAIKVISEYILNKVAKTHTLISTSKDFNDQQDTEKISALLSESKKKALRLYIIADSLLEEFLEPKSATDLTAYCGALLPVYNENDENISIKDWYEEVKKKLDNNKNSEAFKNLSIEYSLALEVLPLVAVIVNTKPIQYEVLEYAIKSMQA